VSASARIVRHARRRLVGLLTALATLAAGEAALRVAGLGDPILYDNRASYGYRPVPDQDRTRLFGARVRVNRLGVRGPDVPEDGLRLLFLGDSVTWGGSYVDDDALFAAVAADRVARALPAWRPVVPLDAGVNGWGPQNVLALVRETGGFGSPLWVLTLLDDDFRRGKTGIGEVPYFNVAPRLAWEELFVLAAYKVVTAYKLPKPAEDLERLAHENLDACRAILAAASDAGARVLIVWHPSAAAQRGAPEAYKARALQAASAGGARVLDLSVAYGRRDGLYADGLHLSVAGHRVAGEAIGDRLIGMLAGAAGPGS
jgi:hypothetical protein